MTNTNSNNTITINTTDTLNIDIDHYYGHTIDVSSITTSTIDTSDFDDLFSSDTDFEISITEPKDFITHMPDLHEIEAMCKYYPALEKAYESFKTIYNMVRQDYVGNHKSNEAPF